MSGLRSPLGHARGLGAAKDGVGHWWLQRVTAVALVPLLLWLVVSLAVMTGADHAAARAWVASPPVAITLSLLLVAGFWHLKLGLQVVIEDYVHGRLVKTASLLLMTFAVIVLGAIALFSVLKIAVQG